MSLIWLFILFFSSDVPVLFWWLLIPMFVEDMMVSERLSKLEERVRRIER